VHRRANRTYYVSDEMNWVEIVWTMMIAASLMLGVVHLFVWQKQRSQYAHLLFFALAVSAAIYLILELDTPYSGLITLSDAPLRLALQHLGR